jgi:hypothetical protein
VTATGDQNKESKEKTTCKGLKMILTDNSFIDLLLDALTELECLFWELQKRSTSLTPFHKQMEIKYRAFGSVFCNQGKHF